MLADKDVHGLLAALEPLLAEVVVTTRTPRPARCRPTSWRRWRWTSSASTGSRSSPRLPEALETAVRLADEAAAELGGGAGVLVTGSVVTAADGRLLFGLAEA